jgi:hypothetical protein
MAPPIQPSMRFFQKPGLPTRQITIFKDRRRVLDISTTNTSGGATVMASERQIEANRQNASRSKGPTSILGKSRSRLNSTKHGLAAELPTLEAGHSPEFLDRRAKWSEEFQPVDEAAQWALDRAVAASLRIERCERAIDGIADAARDRAGLAWDQDRAVEAATIAGRLARDPVLASRQLETTRAGVVLLLELWLRLVEAIRAEGGWSDSDASKALDLLGVPADLRSGRTPIDAPEGTDPLAFREALALDEIERLKSLRDEVMDELDEIERNRAMVGDEALFSKSAKLVLRYEREAWRRYRESIREVRDSASATVEAPPTPSPIPIEATVRPATAKPPATRQAPPPDPGPPMSFEQERRELLAEAKAFLASIGQPIVPMDLDEEEALLAELESRTQDFDWDPTSARPVATERTQSAGRAYGPARGGA